MASPQAPEATFLSPLEGLKGPLNALLDTRSGQQEAQNSYNAPYGA